MSAPNREDGLNEDAVVRLLIGAGVLAVITLLLVEWPLLIASTLHGQPTLMAPIPAVRGGIHWLGGPRPRRPARGRVVARLPQRAPVPFRLDRTGRAPGARDRRRRERHVGERGPLARAAGGRLPRLDPASNRSDGAVCSWWTDHVEATLARSTIESYAHVLDKHLLPRLGDVPIRDIDSGCVVDLQRDLRADQVGPAMTHRVMMVLSGIMRHAVGPPRTDAPFRSTDVGEDVGGSPPDHK